MDDSEFAWPADSLPVDIAMYKIYIEMALTSNYDVMRANIRQIVCDYGELAYKLGKEDYAIEISRIN